MFGTEFFFLRPVWLLLLVPAAGLVWLALKERSTGDSSAWRGLVDAHLLAVLSVGGKKAAPNRLLASLLGIGLLSAILAMAGPTWEKIELPSYKTKDPTVIALSLAQSMNATDVKPTRLTRAGHKVRDILERMEGGDVGLVIYSDRPFTASPLTEDGEVIGEMLPELSTSLMPVLGNRADRAIAEATELLVNAGAAAGRIVLIADTPGTDLDATLAAARAAEAAGYTVDVLSVGKDAASPLLSPSGTPITGADGKAMAAGFDAEGLAAVAAAGGGIAVPLSAGSSDVARIIPAEPLTPESGLAAEGLKADGWHDMGYLLLVVPILLAPFAFRRNVLMGAVLALLFAPALLPGEAHAAGLKDLWQTPDQQAAAAFDAADYASAAATFEDPEWQASAHYRAGDYAAAAATLSSLETADAAYNRGNALAKSGNLEAALQAYEASLAIRPDDADTIFNRDLVARLLEEQQQQQQNQQQQSDQDQQQDQQQQSGQDQQQDQQQQSGEEQQQDQQQQSGQEQQDQQQQAGQQQQQVNQTEPRQEGEKEAEAADAAEATEEEKNAFQQAMDALLRGNAEPTETEEEPQAVAAAHEMSEREQANEQLLRRVPDDASGLLRARIMQNYRRTR